MGNTLNGCVCDCGPTVSFSPTPVSSKSSGGSIYSLSKTTKKGELIDTRYGSKIFAFTPNIGQFELSKYLRKEVKEKKKKKSKESSAHRSRNNSISNHSSHSSSSSFASTHTSGAPSPSSSSAGKHSSADHHHPSPSPPPPPWLI
ncbi:hypothetical protein TYRP_011346 [Tyrophagus putrescentiae]|nr:hypothetical protein TYRP_011346 [Tyrophagus putrescentiae]